MAVPPSPPEDPPAPSEAADDVASTGECPRCGTPYEAGQEYCLECGLRLPVHRGVVAALSGVWRRRIPWYPGDWIWPVLLGLVIAAGGAAAAIVYSTGQKPTRTLVETPPVHSSTTATAPPEQSTSSTTTTTKPPPPPPPPARPTVVSWPAGTSGYTVVLTSVPATGGRAAAVAQARRALVAGLKRVGVLDSSQYSSLHPGYYVVFSGVFENPADAQTAAGSAHSRGYGAAYPRRITP